MYSRIDCQCLRLSCCLVLMLGASAAYASSPVDQKQDKPTAAMRSYFSANGLLNRSLYDLAATEYESFLAEYSQHEKAPMARYGLGVCLFRQQKYEPALEQLNILRRDESFVYHAEVAVMTGHTYLALRQYLPAANAFDGVLHAHATHDLADDATAGATEALYSLGQFDEAVKRCQWLVSQWPRSPHRDRIELLWGMSAMASEDYATAAKHLSLLLERSPQGSMADQATLLLAQSYHHLNSVQEAIRQYRDTLSRGAKQYTAEAMLGLATLLHQQGQLDEASILLKQLLKQFPQSNLTITAQFRLARIRFDENHYEQALPVFARLAKSSHASQDKSAYWAGKCELRLGQFKKASQRLDSFTDHFESSLFIADARYDKAIAYIQAGEIDAGIDSLKSFRTLHPDHKMSADALYMIVSLLHQQRMYDDSIKSARLFLKSYSKHDNADSVAFVLAENHYLSNRFDDAIAGYDRLIKHFPQSKHLGSALHRLGVSLYQIHNFKRSADVLNRAMSDFPSAKGFDTSHFVLGDMAFQRREWNQSLKHFSTYISKLPNDASAADALLKMGLCYQRQQQHELALSTFDQVLTRFPDSPHRLQATFEKGQALLALERKVQASEFFTAVIKESPNSQLATYARNHLASIAMTDGQFDIAASLLEQMNGADIDSSIGNQAMLRHGQALIASKQFVQAASVLEELLTGDVDIILRAQALAHLTISITRQNRCEEALRQAKKMTKAMRESLDASIAQSFQYECAWCYRQVGNTDRAATIYKEIFAAGGSNSLRAHALLDLGALAFEKGDFDQALKRFQQLQQLVENSNDSEISNTLKEQLAYRLGVSSFELQFYDKTALYLTGFAQTFPDSPLIASASFYCGESLYKLGKFGQAIPHLSRVVDEFTGDATYRPSLLRLGQSLAQLHRWSRSEQAFTTFLTKYPDDAQHFQASFGVGWARENQARQIEAIKAYQTVIDTHTGPTAARAQFQIGECYFALKKYDQATRELLKVDILYAYPQWSAAALYEAGRCFEMMAKSAEARSQFVMVTEKYGDSKWAPLAKQRLSAPNRNPLPGK